jgi:hypothetical protein
VKTLLLLLALAPAVLLAQTPRDAAAPPATTAALGIIAGNVVSDDASATPVRRAVIVAASTDQRGDRRTVTDDQGHFVLAELPPGHYSLSAAKAGWLTAYFGSSHPGRPAFGGATVALAAGQHITSIALKMLHGGVIAGTVSDPFGRTQTGVDVRVATVRVQDGQRQLVEIDGNGRAGQSFATTDDRGAFRIFGLAPGDYVILAMPGFLDNFGGGEVLQLTADSLAAARRSLATATPGSPASGGTTTPPASTPEPRQATVGAANVYYPGTVDVAGATVIRLNPGEERTDVDFAVQLVPTARVQGVVMGPDGQPSANANVQLIAPATGLGGFFDNASTRTGPDGHFQFVGVAPGPYQIVARAADSSAAPAAGRGGGAAGSGVTAMSTDSGMVFFNGNPRAMALWATDDISVAGQDITGISLSLQRGATVSGRMVFAATSLQPPQDMSRFRLSLVPAADAQRLSLGAVGAQTEISGAFHFFNVPPGRYRVNVIVAPTGRGGGPAPPAAASGWVLKSAMSGDVDAIDQAIDIAIGTTQSDLVVTLGDKLGEISGAVRKAGQPVTDYRMVVFSADKAMWGATGRRMRAPVQTEPDGTFRVEGLPARR